MQDEQERAMALKDLTGWARPVPGAKRSARRRGSQDVEQMPAALARAFEDLRRRHPDASPVAWQTLVDGERTAGSDPVAELPAEARQRVLSVTITEAAKDELRVTVHSLVVESD